MANALPAYDTLVAKLRHRDLGLLAPRFRERVEQACSDAQALGAQVLVFETLREDELARLYFQHGVSKAETVDHTWHGYGLAVDVIHPDAEWSKYPGEAHYDAEWWGALYRAFSANGLASGSDWKSFKDYPHWQPTEVPASPTPEDIAQRGDLPALWARYHLDGG